MIDKSVYFKFEIKLLSCNSNEKGTNFMAEKDKFQIEFSINSSPKVLYNRLSTPAGLSEWFADDVNVEDNNNIFVFIWDGYEQRARVISKKDQRHIRFQWIDDEEEGINSFFEFKINIDDLTSDVALVITDFAESDEKDDAINLWETQVSDLRHMLGS